MTKAGGSTGGTGKKKAPAPPVDIPAMTADWAHGFARLHDRRPEDFKVLIDAVQSRMGKLRLPAPTGRYDDFDDPVLLAAVTEQIGPLTRELMRDHDVRSALGRLAADYARLPTTDAIRLRTSKDTHSIPLAAFALLTGGTLIGGALVLAYAAYRIDQALEEKKKKKEEEDYDP